MGLVDVGVAAAVEPLDEVELPQRPGEVERLGHQPADELAQLGVVAGAAAAPRGARASGGRSAGRRPRPGCRAPSGVRVTRWRKRGTRLSRFSTCSSSSLERRAARPSTTIVAPTWTWIGPRSASSEDMSEAESRSLTRRSRPASPAMYSSRLSRAPERTLPWTAGRPAEQNPDRPERLARPRVEAERVLVVGDQPVRRSESSRRSSCGPCGRLPRRCSRRPSGPSRVSPSALDVRVDDLEVLAALAEHPPHRPDLVAVQVAEDRVGEVARRARSRRPSPRRRGARTPRRSGRSAAALASASSDTRRSYPYDRGRWPPPASATSSAVGSGSCRASGGCECRCRGRGCRTAMRSRSRSGDGVVLFDTGYCFADVGTRQLEFALAQVGLELGDVRLLVCTHAHTDHYGLAGPIIDATGCELWMHPAWEHVRGLADDPEGALERRIEVARQSGVPAGRVARVREVSARRRDRDRAGGAAGSRARARGRGGDRPRCLAGPRDAGPRAVARRPPPARERPADLGRPPARADVAVLRLRPHTGPGRRVHRRPRQGRPRSTPASASPGTGARFATCPRRSPQTAPSSTPSSAERAGLSPRAREPRSRSPPRSSGRRTSTRRWLAWAPAARARLHRPSGASRRAGRTRGFRAAPLAAGLTIER